MSTPEFRSAAQGAPRGALFVFCRVLRRALGVGAFAALLQAPVLAATDVAVAGIFSDKAVLVINGGEPRILRVGASTPEGIRLLSVGDGRATLMIDGRQQTLALGGRSVHTAATSRPDSVMLRADESGHYFAEGRINGAPVQFLVDTGATVVSLGRRDAERLGIGYAAGRPGYAITASGQVRLWQVTLDQVSVGDITLYDVPAAVHDWDMPIALLGMSFLGQLNMSREGDRMLLQRRF